MQIRKKPAIFTNFGGINFIHDYLKSKNLESVIREHLGTRSVRAFYSYGDILSQMAYTKFIGGQVLDDHNELRAQMENHPDLEVASPDTIEYAFQELKQPTIAENAQNGSMHYVNEHNGFNKLLPYLCRHFGLLHKDTAYMLDYDGHIVENNKRDNAFTYKKTEGYYPVMCMIDKLPVYMQSRKGNTPEGYGQLPIIKKALQGCEDNNITVTAFRADACCYERATIEYLESRNITYYIRAEKSMRLLDALADEKDWQPATIGNRRVEVCSVEEPLFTKETKYRIVAYREKKKGQQTIEDRGGYSFHTVVTSDTTSSPLQCILIYNQRGCKGEHHFKELDYDFDLNKLPFDTFEMNTVYMYAMIVSYILFNACKKHYSQKLDFVSIEMRLKRFILHFVSLPAKWISTARTKVLNIYTTKNYDPIFQT